METNFGPEHDVRTHIDELDQDRAALMDRLQAPWGLMAAAGAAVAWFVADAVTAQPGASYRPSTGYLLAVAAILIVGHLTQKEVGVRFRRIGAAGWLAIGATTAVALIMFIVGLALVSTGYRWLAVLPVLVAWAVGTWGAAGVFRSCVRAAGRG